MTTETKNTLILALCFVAAGGIGFTVGTRFPKVKPPTITVEHYHEYVPTKKTGMPKEIQSLMFEELFQRGFVFGMDTYRDIAKGITDQKEFLNKASFIQSNSVWEANQLVDAFKDFPTK